MAIFIQDEETKLVRGVQEGFVGRIVRTSPSVCSHRQQRENFEVLDALRTAWPTPANPM